MMRFDGKYNRHCKYSRVRAGRGGTHLHDDAQGPGITPLVDEGLALGEGGLHLGVHPRGGGISRCRHVAASAAASRLSFLGQQGRTSSLNERVCLLWRGRRLSLLPGESEDKTKNKRKKDGRERVGAWLSFLSSFFFLSVGSVGAGKGCGRFVHLSGNSRSVT